MRTVPFEIPFPTGLGVRHRSVRDYVPRLVLAPGNFLVPHVTEAPDFLRHGKTTYKSFGGRSYRRVDMGIETYVSSLSVEGRSLAWNDVACRFPAFGRYAFGKTLTDGDLVKSSCLAEDRDPETQFRLDSDVRDADFASASMAWPMTLLSVADEAWVSPADVEPHYVVRVDGRTKTVTVRVAMSDPSGPARGACFRADDRGSAEAYAASRAREFGLALDDDNDVLEVVDHTGLAFDLDRADACLASGAVERGVGPPDARDHRQATRLDLAAFGDAAWTERGTSWSREFFERYDRMVRVNGFDPKAETPPRIPKVGHGAWEAYGRWHARAAARLPTRADDEADYLVGF